MACISNFERCKPHIDMKMGGTINLCSTNRGFKRLAKRK